MKDFIIWLVKNIVDDPDSVSVEEINEDGWTNYQVKVAQTDMGKVIGKGGKIIKAVRNLVKIKAIKENRQVALELIENNS